MTRLINSIIDPVLFKGYSEDTIPRMVIKRDDYPPVDSVLVDGGHLIETVSSDWENAHKLMLKHAIVVFDGHYMNCPDLIGKFGCSKIIDSLDKATYNVEFLEDIDSFDQDCGKCDIRMVEVALRNYG